MITVEDYFKAYTGHPEITPAIKANAVAMLQKVNELRRRASDDGVEFKVNPISGTSVAGETNGGFRPSASTVGAPASKHKQGRAVDNYDPDRRFASWCIAHEDDLRELRLHMERSEWTPSWVHLQDVAPLSGLTYFIPSTAPTLASAPEPWA
jgi:hypothetical protein